jgi:hypothetical protein
MSKLEPGCLATVIQSVDGLSVGKTVQCVSIIGEHSEYGTTWKVHCRDELISEYGAIGNYMDYPAIWLKKIEPPTMNLRDKNVELVG